MEKTYPYCMQLTNKTKIYFISDIEDLVKINTGIMQGKFVLVENICINTDKIVLICRVHENSLCRRECKEFITVIK